MRRSGILMHITSLPSLGGIGTLGRAAYEFVDMLVASGLSVWQVLPIGPTGYGESPYQSGSTFAGNPLLIDLFFLKERGLLEDVPVCEDAEKVDYNGVREVKLAALRRAFENGYAKLLPDIEAFRRENPWLSDYALFAACKEYNGNGMWRNWKDDGLKRRLPSALNAYMRKLKTEFDFNCFLQYIFFQQWYALKAYANARGIAIFGDMPIYVAEDSADAWANPGIFQLDENLEPKRIAGVPPDYFSADGQRWGNPLYDWKALKQRRFDWWLTRLSAAGKMFDWVRIDHFIGFANYYSIPANESTARNGHWEKAPGFSFFRRVKRELPNITIIAENLGEVNARVKRLMRYCGYPGMKVACFGFDSDETNPHFIANFTPNNIAYTGTHDNDTIMGWWAKAGKKERDMARRNLPDAGDICDSMIEAVFNSACHTAIVPMQDFLHLGGEARMNYPGTVGGNWEWRMLKGAFTPELAEKIKALNTRNGR